MAKEYVIRQPRRLTLTKAQAQSEVGQKLTGILMEICADGFIFREEAKRLSEWLEKEDDGTIFSVSELKWLLRQIFKDDRLDASEASELIALVMRILPAEQRHAVLETRRKAAQQWQPSPVTEKQATFIKDLGGNVPAGLTKSDASEMIASLLTKPRPPTNRQMMVLRFWDRLDLATGTLDSVSEWMDEHYASDPRHRQAWERYKEEAGDDGSQGNPDRVPIGIGKSYMSSIISEANPFSGPNPGRSSSAKSGCSATTVVVLFLILPLALLAAALIYDKTLWPRLLAYLAGAAESVLGR